MGNSKKVTGSALDEPGGSRNQEIEPPQSKIVAAREKEHWHLSQKNSLQTIEELSRHIPFPSEDIPQLKQVEEIFHLRVPLYYLSLIRDPANPADPIRKQCVPSLDEINDDKHEHLDPLGEERTSPYPCLVHRYPDRVLLLVTGRCFMYCRHCTRKRLWRSHLPDPTLKQIEEALTYVKANRQIREVVISGGDPLTLATERLEYIISLVARCENVQAIRIGTRAPVTLPQRIDNTLCRMLERCENLWVNVQFNHPGEITPESTAACRKLQKCGIPISNQSVLLKGINDDPAVMMALCRQLQSIRVRPYYLFQCDPVVGASHFRTSVWKGLEIIEKMRGHTGGMCVPTFVVDGIDGKGKVPLSPNYLISMSDDGVLLRNYQYETFYYHNPRD